MVEWSCPLEATPGFEGLPYLKYKKSVIGPMYVALIGQTGIMTDIIDFQPQRATMSAMTTSPQIAPMPRNIAAIIVKDRGMW